MERFRLDGQVAVVVGGTGALGGAMARGLAAAGAAVAVAGRNETRGEQVVEAIEAAGGRAAFIPCDAGSREHLVEARELVLERLGEPSVLVNAAGGNQPAVTLDEQLRFEDVDLQAWRNCLDLNLAAGVLLPCQVFGPPMKAAGRGSIVNIASISAHVPLSRVVAREWAPAVRVNSITPGFFPGEQNRRLLFQEDGEPTERGRQILEGTPMGRFGDPAELVGAAVFLASHEASSFVTGADLPVDGGFLASAV